MGSRRVGHDWATSLSIFTFMHWRRKMATHSSVLAWRIPGTGEPGGLPSLGSHRVEHDWSDLAAAAHFYWRFHVSYPVLRALHDLNHLWNNLKQPSMKSTFTHWTNAFWMHIVCQVFSLSLLGVKRKLRHGEAVKLGFEPTGFRIC